MYLFLRISGLPRRGNPIGTIMRIWKWKREKKKKSCAPRGELAAAFTRPRVIGCGRSGGNPYGRRVFRRPGTSTLTVWSRVPRAVVGGITARAAGLLLAVRRSLRRARLNRSDCGNEPSFSRIVVEMPGNSTTVCQIVSLTNLFIAAKKKKK